MRSIKTLFGCCLALSVVFSDVVYGSILEEKLNFERSIKERAELLVERIIGSKDMIVLVNVELEQEDSTKTKRKEDEGGYRGMAMTEEEYLPGITYSYMPAGMESSVITSRGVNIKRIDVLVTIDAETPEDVVKRIKKEVSEILGLNPVRGDAVRVTKIAFAKNKKTWIDLVHENSRDIYGFAALLIAVMFLFGSVRGFFKNVAQKYESEAKVTASSGAGGAGGMTVLSGNQSIYSRSQQEISHAGMGGVFGSGDSQSGDKKGEPGLVHRFSFIGESNMARLAYLLKNETPERIAMVIGYLSADKASYIINKLAINTQAQVAAQLSRVRLFPSKDIENVEKEIKDKITCLIGGEEYFTEIVDRMDRSTQDAILSVLAKQDQNIADKIRSAIFFFEDIVVLDKNALQKVIREIQRQNMSLALALKNADESVRNKVMGALTEGAQAMLTEQIDLLGETSDIAIANERRRIAHIVRELHRTGIIHIERGSSI